MATQMYGKIGTTRLYISFKNILNDSLTDKKVFNKYKKHEADIMDNVIFKLSLF
jgi:hypothetical protein